MISVTKSLPLGMMALLGAAWSSPALADAQIIFSGTLIDSPTCEINNNQRIDVPFGDDLITTRVDGVNYKKEIEYTLNCEQAASNAMRMTIKGTTAPFGSGLLTTNKTGLGIQLYVNTTTALTLGSGVNFMYPGKPVLHAVPVAQDNKTLTAGSFTGSATMVIEYQ